MASRREIQLSEEIAHMAADFFARESNARSLVTVTRALLSPDLKKATIFLSVLPDSYEDSVLAFAKRNRTDFRDYVKEKSALHRIPTMDFEIDYGEKNRQRIDDLTRIDK